MKWFVSFLFVLLALPALAAPTALTVQEVSETSATVSPTTADTTNLNSIANPTGDIFLIATNSHASSSATVTVGANGATFEFPGYGSVTKASNTITLAAQETEIVGPFQTRTWNNSSGLVIVTTTGTASGSVQLKAFRLKPSLRQ